MKNEIPGLDLTNDVHERVKHVLDNYKRSELFHLLVQLQIKADYADKLMKDYEILENKYWESKQEFKEIKDHWDALHEHLEKYPELKEEWDNFCMAIKLTED